MPATNQERSVRESLHRLLDAILDVRRLYEEGQPETAPDVVAVDEVTKLLTFLGAEPSLVHSEGNAFERWARLEFELPDGRPLSVATILVRAWDKLGSFVVGPWFRRYIAERGDAALEGFDKFDIFDDFDVQNAIDLLTMIDPAALRRLLRELLEDLGYFRLPREIAWHLREAFEAFEHGEIWPVLETKRKSGRPFTRAECRRVAVEAVYALRGLGRKRDNANESVCGEFGTSPETLLSWEKRLKKAFPDRNLDAEWREAKALNRRLCGRGGSISPAS